MDFLKKHWTLLLAFLAGIATIFFLKRDSSVGETSSQDGLIAEKEKELDKIEEKLDNLKVEDKTVEEELEYWRNQK